MVFSSPIFLFLFLPLLFAVHLAVPRRGRNAVLLAASVIFYAWGERLFFAVMLASILINWLFGLLIEARPTPATRRAAVVGAVVVNIGLLGFYKYAGFVVDNLNAVLAPLGVAPFVVDVPHLPLGISFFTFHALSYVVDIYRRDAEAQRNPIDFALYIAFFPQLVAGPIIRYHDIFRQLTERRFTLDLAASGVERFVTGLGKKAILANPLGEVADGIFGLPIDRLSPEVAWVGVVAYGLQIYLDFSAYSDMAIGLARMFGFNFLENFDYPYRARSVREFWRRWHISLSNFLRDYLYVPLGGNRVAEWRVWFNQIFVFFVCGLWHGANWTFVVWGLLHGFYLSLERTAFGRLLDRAPRVVQHAWVLLAVGVAWVFFRAADLGSAVGYLRAMVGLGGSGGEEREVVERFVDPLVLVVAAIAVPAAAGLFTRVTADWRARAGQVRGEVHPPIETVRMAAEVPWVLGLRGVLMIAIALIAFARIAAGTYNPFIYFRF